MHSPTQRLLSSYYLVLRAAHRPLCADITGHFRRTSAGSVRAGSCLHERHFQFSQGLVGRHGSVSCDKSTC